MLDLVSVESRRKKAEWSKKGKSSHIWEKSLYLIWGVWCVFSQSMWYFHFILSQIFSSLFSRTPKNVCWIQYDWFKFGCYCCTCHLAVNKSAVIQLFCWAFHLSSHKNCLSCMTIVASMSRKSTLNVNLLLREVLLSHTNFHGILQVLDGCMSIKGDQKQHHGFERYDRNLKIFIKSCSSNFHFIHRIL